jgi:hypothetical protein
MMWNASCVVRLEKGKKNHRNRSYGGGSGAARVGAGGRSREKSRRRSLAEERAWGRRWLVALT